MSEGHRRRRGWLVGVAATGGVALGVVTAAGATSPPAVTQQQASTSEALGLDQQVISLSQHEVNLQGELEAARRAAAAELASAAQPAPASSVPETVPSVIAPAPNSGEPGAQAAPLVTPTPTTQPSEDGDPTPTSAPPAATTTLPTVSTTTTTTGPPPTTTTTRPRHGGGGGGGD